MGFLLYSTVRTGRRCYSALNTVENHLNCFHIHQYRPLKKYNNNRMETKQLPYSTTYVHPPPPIPSVSVVNHEDLVFPVHRIYCVAKNYYDHIKEMGGDPVRDSPCFFMKPPDAIVECGCVTDQHQTTTTTITTNKNIVEIPYPMKTNNLHYEIELVIAIGVGGINIHVDNALSHVFGYAVGCDLTRRDLQTIAKTKGQPWDSSKSFDRSAPIGFIYPAETFHNNFFQQKLDTHIWLHVNEEQRQYGNIKQMIWNIPEIISNLSNEFELQSGDLIYTGTPAGVGCINIGDTVKGGIDGLGELQFQIV